MKKIIMALLFSLTTHASNFIPVSTIQNNSKAGYSLLADCQRASAPDEVCQDVGDQPLESYEVYTYEVDDESRPIFSKTNEQSCISLEDCSVKFIALECTLPKFSVKNLDLMQVYCAERIGYFKKQLKSIRQSATLLSNFNTNKVLAESAALQESKLQEKIKLLDAGKRVIALLNLRNESKNLTTAQVGQLISTFSNIKSALETGSLVTAKYLISQVTPDGVVITSADKAALIAELDKFIVAP